MKVKNFLFIFLLVSALAACTNDSSDDDGGGDDGNDRTELSQNACSSLNLGTRIITGSECSENNSPVVEISLGFPDGRSGICSGTMITSEWVLTAAHCFFENPSSIVVSASGVSVTGQSVRSHPDVRVDDSQKAVFNDVALIRLSSAVTLPTLPIVASKAPVSGDVIKIFGYGLSEVGNPFSNTLGTLRSGEMRISDANSFFVDAFYDGEGSNTCSGDSGGPALLEVNGRLGIVGVLSSGELVSCGEGDTSRFTNVQGSSNLSFITSIVSGVDVI